MLYFPSIIQGYALIEYSTLAEAREAISQTNNTKLLDQTIYADFAFVRPPLNSNANRGGGAGGGHGRRGGGNIGRDRGRSRRESEGHRRERSRSPGVKENDAEEPAAG